MYVRGNWKYILTLPLTEPYALRKLDYINRIYSLFEFEVRYRSHFVFTVPIFHVQLEPNGTYINWMNWSCAKIYVPLISGGICIIIQVSYTTEIDLFIDLIAYLIKYENI